MEDHKINILN